MVRLVRARADTEEKQETGDMHKDKQPKRKIVVLRKRDMILKTPMLNNRVCNSGYHKVRKRTLQLEWFVHLLILHLLLRSRKRRRSGQRVPL